MTHPHGASLDERYKVPRGWSFFRHDLRPTGPVYCAEWPAELPVLAMLESRALCVPKGLEPLVYALCGRHDVIVGVRRFAAAVRAGMTFDAARFLFNKGNAVPFLTAVRALLPDDEIPRM